MRKELVRILDFWNTQAVDSLFGGFYGELNHVGKPIANTPKSLLLHVRILWALSKGSLFLKDNRYDQTIESAYNYLVSNFKDKAYNGVYWEIDYKGMAPRTDKHIFAQAACINALMAYYEYSKNTQAIAWAVRLSEIVEIKAKDQKNGGYFEAYTKEWQPIPDFLETHKGFAIIKTARTHLQLLEAYTRLVQHTSATQHTQILSHLVALFEKHILKNEHVQLYFGAEWQPLGDEISFGHDIQTAWILLEAAATLDNEYLKNQVIKSIDSLMNCFIQKAFDASPGVCSTYATGPQPKYWWVQAEAMVGLYRWAQFKNDNHYQLLSQQLWDFIQKDFILPHGEWALSIFRGQTSDAAVASTWKGPFHNTRALLGILSFPNF